MGQGYSRFRRGVKSLRNKVKQKDIVINKLESNLGRYRMESFDDDYEDVHEFDYDLVGLINASGRIKSKELVR